MALLLAVVDHLVDPLVPSGSRPPASAQAPAQHTPVLPARRASAVALQVVAELGGGVLAPPVRGGRIVSPCRVRAPAGRHIARLAHQGPVPRAVAPVAYPTAFLVQQPATVARQIEHLPGADTGGCRPPTCSPGWPAAGARAGPGRGAGPGPGSGGGGAGTFRRGCAATRPCSRTGGCAPPPGGCLNAPAGPGGVSTAVPVGAAGAVEDPLDQGAELFPASHGS